MRNRVHVAVLVCLVAAGCGDGIDEGANEGRGERGTIDGVTLDTPRPDDSTDDTVGGGGSDDTPDTIAATDDPFEWNEVGDGIEEGTLDVPLDYDDPNGASITLYVVRHRAVDPARRIGTLLVNPGGPGYGGSGLAYSADGIYGQELLDRFDILGWDPRGTGFSAPAVDCIDDYDRYFGLDSSPDTNAEREALIDAGTDFGEECASSVGEVLPHLGTADSARDMDAIRRALREPAISYFGFSYGSELGATWTTMFPETVRAAVLDGAIDPTVGYLQQNIQQAAGFEATFDEFLRQCSADTGCAFHNDADAATAFDELSADIDAHPLTVDRDRTEVTQAVLFTAVADAMYDQSYWPSLELALADLQDGDGQGVLDLYDDYFGYLSGQWGDELEAYFAINCLDDPGSTGPDDLFSHEDEFAAAAPRLGRGWMAELVFCSVWPVPPAAPVAITGAGAGPILVMGTTGDPATPLAGTRRMAQALQDGHLVVVEADQHTGYGVNNCGDSTVDDYLVDPTMPLADEIDCT
ncbi:MAG: alpha/beta fold hydrolase [Actinobacteria bacterium]|nr:alpha/beta fold hydrolase [Actinomycetota bacterium]